MAKSKEEKKIEKAVKWAEKQAKAVKEAKPEAEALEPEVCDLETMPLAGSQTPPPEVFANKVGRPTKYSDSYPEQAKLLCSKGFIDLDLADFFKVSESTIDNWKNEHKEFLGAIKEGKDLMDSQVEKSLLQRALGYSHAEEKVFCSEGEIVTHETVKHYPPDPTSMIFWLKNRRPKVWRDKHEVDFTNPLTLNMSEADQKTL